MNVIYLVVAGLIGYFSGAIPFGFMYVKAKTNLDLRDIGSGRTGGTNSFRAAGFKVGLVTSISDVLKGFAAVWLTRLLLGNALGEWLPWGILAASVMTIVGHNWSIFLNWKGGAGTGPNVGWSTAVWLPMLPIGTVIMGGLLWLVGMASVASMVMAALIPITFAIFYFTGIHDTPAYMVAGILTAAIVLWALRPNIKRLLNGTERIVGPRAKRRQMKQQMQNAESG